MNDIADRIALGKATLLSIEDICTRLGVSRSTFDRWVRNGGEKTKTSSSGAVLASAALGVSVSSINKLVDQAENSTEGVIIFPPPDVRIGNSPKWELETFKKWIQANVVAS